MPCRSAAAAHSADNTVVVSTSAADIITIASIADMKLVVVLSVLGLATTGHAIKCYICKSPQPIANVSAIGTALSLLIHAPSCQQFAPGNPDWNKKFVKECPADKSCLKVTDPNDGANEARGCFPAASSNQCANGTCFCDTDLCNGSRRGWPSAVLLATAALAAALLGGR